jgi:Co/Zn/Cd efflux system component
LIVNGGVALMLPLRRREHALGLDDALGNLAVMLAAIGVFGTGTGWLDVIVAVIMGGLGLWGGWQIVNQARDELRTGSATETVVAAE